MARQDHSESDCFVCVVLSHGDETGIWATDVQFKLEDMMERINPINCPSLAFKPKIFILQVSVVLHPFTPTDHLSSIQNNEWKSPIKLLTVLKGLIVINDHLKIRNIDCYPKHLSIQTMSNKNVLFNHFFLQILLS